MEAANATTEQQLRSYQRCLADLGRAALAEETAASMLTHAVEQLRATLGARAVGVFEPHPEALVLAAGSGFMPHIQPAQLPLLDLPAVAAPVGAIDGLAGARYLKAHDLTTGLACRIAFPGGSDGLLVVLGVSQTHDPETSQLVTSVAELASGGLRRRHIEDQHVAGERRLKEAQELAHVGSYDWNIVTDTNVWSDELYRIYGSEPQSFNASYDEFLARIHPEDRGSVMAVHQKAFESRRPYTMRERIIRPDGSVRILDTTGEVVTDDDDNPIRMRGICIDVTERVEAEQQRAEITRAEELRRQALEINDSVVQGLTSVVWSIESTNADAALIVARETLESARAMMSRMLDGEAGFDSGDLDRSDHAPGVLADRWTAPDVERSARARAIRIAIADDAPDIRLLLQMQLRLQVDCDLVGEATTGREAVEVAALTQPDLFLLDVAMPNGNGIDAIPEILRVSPDTSIIMLSGFASRDLQQMALDAGAVAYVEKGAINNLLEALAEWAPVLFAGRTR